MKEIQNIIFNKLIIGLITYNVYLAIKLFNRNFIIKLVCIFKDTNIYII